MTALSTSAPSASNLIVTESVAGPTQFFVTSTATFSVFVFVTVKPVATSPVIAES